MAKRKPPQPKPINMLAYNGGNPHHQASQEHPANGGNRNSTEYGPQDASHFSSNSSESNAAYAKLDNSLKDFIYGISRGYSVRHSCRMSGEDYERMLDYLNNRSRFFKPELLKLVDKARAVAYARAIEKLNAATDWHAAAFWLERRERREFGPVRLGNSEEEDSPERKALVMSPETLDALSEAYDAEHGNAEQEKEQS